MFDETDLVAEMVREHAAHTVILYGSRALEALVLCVAGPEPI